ncbi:hypothetical protein ABZ638_02990 [Streptomyces sp. NPDC007107]|uniref:hypothetical protein n=1 Tax=Streptomyces sp. NPDC007107 TaxID=3156915 RepID=UPI003403EA25
MDSAAHFPTSVRPTTWGLLGGLGRRPAGKHLGLPLRLTLPAERTGRIAELAAAEQRCRPFFDFRLHLDGPYLHLEVRAPAEGTGLLVDLFGPAA